MTIRQRVKVKPGGVVEVADPDLPPGEDAEVTVVVETAAERASEGRVEGDAARPLWQRIVDIGAAVPAEDWEQVPRDLSKSLDHYLYGAPREEE